MADAHQIGFATARRGGPCGVRDVPCGPIYGVAYAAVGGKRLTQGVAHLLAPLGACPAALSRQRIPSRRRVRTPGLRHFRARGKTAAASCGGTFRPSSSVCRARLAACFEKPPSGLGGQSLCRPVRRRPHRGTGRTDEPATACTACAAGQFRRRYGETASGKRLADGFPLFDYARLRHGRGEFLSWDVTTPKSCSITAWPRPMLNPCPYARATWRA